MEGKGYEIATILACNCNHRISYLCHWNERDRMELNRLDSAEQRNGEDGCSVLSYIQPAILCGSTTKALLMGPLHCSPHHCELPQLPSPGHAEGLATPWPRVPDPNPGTSLFVTLL